MISQTRYWYVDEGKNFTKNKKKESGFNKINILTEWDVDI